MTSRPASWSTSRTQKASGALLDFRASKTPRIPPCRGGRAQLAVEHDRVDGPRHGLEPGEAGMGAQRVTRSAERRRCPALGDVDLRSLPIEAGLGDVPGIADPRRGARGRAEYGRDEHQGFRFPLARDAFHASALRSSGLSLTTRARPATRALSARSSALNAFARAMPPRRPSETAAGSFLLDRGMPAIALDGSRPALGVADAGQPRARRDRAGQEDAGGAGRVQPSGAAARGDGTLHRVDERSARSRRRGCVAPRRAARRCGQ